MEKLEGIKLSHRHFILAPHHKVIQFQNDIENIKLAQAEGNISMKNAQHEEIFYEEKGNDLKLIVGVRSVNYLSKG